MTTVWLEAAGKMHLAEINWVPSVAPRTRRSLCGIWWKKYVLRPLTHGHYLYVRGIEPCEKCLERYRESHGAR